MEENPGENHLFIVALTILLNDRVAPYIDSHPEHKCPVSSLPPDYVARSNCNMTDATDATRKAASSK